MVLDRITRARQDDRTRQDATINLALQPGRHRAYRSLDTTRGDAQGHRQRESFATKRMRETCGGLPGDVAT